MKKSLSSRSIEMIKEKTGQLFVAGFEGTSAPPELLKALEVAKLSGVILFKRNIGSPEELAALNKSIYDHCPSGPAPIISVDQEGGRVQRLSSPWQEWPSAKSLGECGDFGLIREVGYAMGREMAATGFNLDFAPVLDIHTNPENPIIGDRAFSSQPSQVAPMALAFARGLKESGVIPCGKHFPGHGDTFLDSHEALPYVEHNEERIRKVELLPFQTAATSLPAIMTAHVVFPALDGSNPATLSPGILQGILREEFGFNGLIVSDDLNMKAVAERYSPGDLAVRCLRAGVDLMLVCRDLERLEAARKGVMDEVERDDAFARVVEDAWWRVRGFRGGLKFNHPNLEMMKSIMEDGQVGGPVDKLLADLRR